jgi:hypothetical protein
LRTALEHREADRIPLDFVSTDETAIHASCVAALRGYYGLTPGLDVPGVLPRKHSIHNLQAGTPAANIIAMFDAVRELNGAPQHV